MKKKVLFLLLLTISFALIGCTGTSSTTSVDTSNLTTWTGSVPDWNLAITDDLLSWDAVPGYANYRVLINGESTEIDQTSYDLSSLESGQIYQITVVAIENSFAIATSPAIYFVKGVTIAQTIDLEYDQSQPGDLLAFEGNSYGEILYILDSEWNEITVVEEAGSFMFSEIYLEELTYGFHYFYFTFSEGIVLVNLTKVDSRNPHLVSPAQQLVAMNTDAIYEFDLYDGIFMGLSGNGVTLDDYSFEDGVLTIYSDYIGPKFNDEPERDVLILGYTIQNGPDIIVGYLLIELNNTIVFP